MPAHRASRVPRWHCGAGGFGWRLRATRCSRWSGASRRIPLPRKSTDWSPAERRRWAWAPSTGTSGCSSTQGCLVSSPGHEPASTPTSGPTITSRASAAGASWTSRHPLPNRTRAPSRKGWRSGPVSRSRITGSTSSVVAGSARPRGGLGRVDVVRRRMAVLASRILPRGERQEAGW